MSAEHQINNLKSKKSDIIDSFNRIAINMITHLGKEFKDSIFHKNSVMIKNFFKFKPNDVIVMFIYYVYSYDEFRQKIKSGDDEFFMKQTYNDAKNAGYEIRIFEFKDIWMRMDDKIRLMVKESMKMMIEHSELYVEITDNINKLKK